HRPRAHPDLHSIPTRRSSDLVLRGYQPPADTTPTRLSHFEPGSYATGRVVDVAQRGGVPIALKLRFGGIEGVVPQASLEAFFRTDRKSTRLNSSHVKISYAVF